MSIRHGRLAGITAGLLILVVGMVGCGPKARPGAKVSGKVTYQDKPVPSAKVTFFGEDNQTSDAMTHDDGSYEATSVPLGHVKVIVTTAAPGAAIENAAKNAPGGKRFGKGNPFPKAVTVVTVPAKYSHPIRSDLGLTVNEGSQVYDINLK